MFRKAFTMSVYPQCIAAYQQRHNPIWPELAAILKAHGAHNYSLFLDEQRCLLFGYVEIESESRWQAIAQTEICQQWWASMCELMPTHADNRPVSADLREVFFLK
ncbi:L-rhamnose mutarotase [Izhakiella capsodis]|uniref:L-rhamnose mutarotase n=1 Tax=Izhakiella capsodis TaxID=1367852 RepID=A0A1I4WZB2_9GAMM|nr:L-rhamnose mutarotase [Izhakiella capsodis]SFN18329.1 L-rhamnose mutarotase [Izhakiella capsodis]